MALSRAVREEMVGGVYSVFTLRVSHVFRFVGENLGTRGSVTVTAISWFLHPEQRRTSYKGPYVVPVHVYSLPRNAPSCSLVRRLVPGFSAPTD